MNYSKIRLYILPLVVILICSHSLFAGGWTQPKNQLFAKAYIGTMLASSYKDLAGDNIFYKRDTSALYLNGRDYAMELSGILGGVYAEYGLTDDVTLLLDIPAGRFALHEVYSTDDITVDGDTKADFNITQAVYYGIGTRWKINTGKGVTSLSMMVKIPPGFHNGVASDPHPFLSDGAFQIGGGLEFGYPFKESWLASSLLYNHRFEDLSDELSVHVELGAKNIPSTLIKIYMDILQSMSSFPTNEEFNPRRTILQESYVAAGASFGIYVSENWFLDMGYSARFVGKNTWNIGTFTLGVGATLPEVF
ncbi:MAG: hypothetical protein HYZ54_06990 [Ignavibacteriae bacterium]|nr:hypothetical protein [Ignavibacteriota bacterium]